MLRFLLTLSAAACLLADQVTLKNGDRITGSVVKKDDKTLTVKSDVFGTVAMPWEQVAGIVTDKPLVVVLPSGDFRDARITSTEDRVEIVTEEGPRESSLADILALRDADEQRTYERLLHPAWTHLWAGSVTLGLAGTSGNAETGTFTVGLNAARVTRADKAAVYFNAIRAAAEVEGIEATTAQAIRSGWSYSRNTGGRLFLNAFNDYEYDRFQNLDLRFVLGGGLGYKAWRGERGRLDFLSGAAYNGEKFGPPAPEEAITRNSGELYFGDEFTYKLNSVTSLYENLRAFPNITDGGAFRVNLDLGGNTRLTRWLTWNIAISNRYLSNPVARRSRNDFLYTTGIGVTFTH